MGFKRISLKACMHGYLYRVACRNFSYGVFNERDSGFIGIRSKFGSEYLFTEYHFDCGAPFGTAHPIEPLAQVPEGIEIGESLDNIIDRKTKRPVAEVPSRKEGDKIRFYFLDTGERSDDIVPVWPDNQPLFDWIDQKRKEFSEAAGKMIDEH